MRGATLIELIVSQVIVGIIAAGIFALIGGMTRSYHEEHGATEAQIRLREASSVLLRALQGIGGEEGRAGYLVLSKDWGAAAADTLTIFRADYGLCAGVQGVLEVVDHDLRLERIDLDGDSLPDCPLGTLTGCTPEAVTGRVALIEGESRSAQLLVTSADEAACVVRFETRAVQSLQIAAYNEHFGTAAANVTDVIGELGPVRAVRFGSAVTFSIDAFSDRLLRSTNGQTPVPVMDGVYDLQVVTAHDFSPRNGSVDEATEWSWDGALAGATPENFFGVRVGLVTYGSANAGVRHHAPAVFANRFHDGAPADRRYRASWVFAAARNR